MLIEFTVANYRSFRNEATLSMVASPLTTGNGESDDRNLFVAPDDLSLLTSAAIYGANASGKSNLISAISFMIRFVKTSQESTERVGGIKTESFRFTPHAPNQPSFFEVLFIVEDQHYRYGFEVTTERVEAEWLHILPTTGKSNAHEESTDEYVLFDRNGDTITLGEGFEAEGRDLKNKTRSNALFLSVVAQFDGVVAQKVLEWFRNCNALIGLSDHSSLPYTIRQMRDSEMKSKIVEFVRRMDLGIEDIQLSTIKETPELPQGLREEVQQALSVLLDDSDLERVSVQTAHRLYNDEGDLIGQDFFTMEKHESEGTQKLFAFSGPLLDTLEKGKILIVDELDARLHPLMTRQIIQLFNDPETNPHHAQLVFSTQDTNQLDNRLLRRDQVWFIEKERQGASVLYSLVEFKERDNAVHDKDYVLGRYGAIPYLGDIRQVVME